MKRFVILLLLTLWLTDESDAQFTRYLVRLKNKGASGFTLADPSPYLSARAISRRTRYSIAVDSTDLPVPASYLAQIRAIPNLTLLNVSKWLNAVSVQTSDAAAIAALNALPFVQSTSGLAARSTPGTFRKFPEESTETLPPPSANRPTGTQGDFFSYGTNAYNEIQSIRDKDEFLIPFIDAIMNPLFHTGTPETDQTLLKSLIVFACLMEGLFFYVGFTQILALGRQNKMTGAAEQYQYILRDESMHCNFGIDLINQLKLENPHLWTAEFKTEIKALFQKAVELEYRYAEDTMPRGVLGMNASMFKGYLRYIANRRATQIGLEELFPNETNPFPWMSEMIDLKKERNFFETRVIEYQSGGALSWD